MANPTRLQQDLTRRLVQLLREDGVRAGERLSENGLARRLGVSRTPVRAVLEDLVGNGHVARLPNGRLDLVALPDLPEAPPGADDEDLLLIRISQDRASGTLPDEMSEIELMRRYDLTRPALQRALARLSDLGLIERKAGYGWRFLAGVRSKDVQVESYRFRILIEPAALLEPGFATDPGWLAETRSRHKETMAAPWREASSVAFFEMNADFHEGLAAASGNRFIVDAIRRQTRIRRLSNYDWSFGFERVLQNCREHIEILDYVERGERDVAATLLRSHLMRASLLKRPPRGV